MKYVGNRVIIQAWMKSIVKKFIGFSRQVHSLLATFMNDGLHISRKLVVFHYSRLAITVLIRATIENNNEYPVHGKQFTLT
jgi:hypothetical protein